MKNWFLNWLGWVPRGTYEAMRAELVSVLAVNLELRRQLKERDSRIEQHVSAHEQLKSDHRHIVQHHEHTKAGVVLLGEALKRMKNTQTINAAELNGRFRT